MRNTIIRINVFIISLVAVFVILTGKKVMADTSGICGENLRWTLDDEGVLTISGDGDMYDWTSSDDVPWNDYRDRIKTVIFPEHIRRIGNYSFDNCENLSVVNFVLNVSSRCLIGDYAFAHCTKLVSLDFPDNVYGIGNHCFDSCCNLTYVNFGLQDLYRCSFGDYAFANCTNLTDFNLPDNIIAIGNNCFDSCYNLEYIKIPSKINTVGEYAFANCNNLTNVVLPQGLGVIKDYTFISCDKLTDIVLPDSLYKIGNHAFESCSNLKNVDGKSNLKNIGDYAFAYCTELNTFVMTQRLDYVNISNSSIGDHAFDSCSSLSYFVCPKIMSSIGEYAFSSCFNLTNVVLPKEIKMIGRFAFNNCISLESAIIPHGISTINACVFNKCSSLSYVYITKGIEIFWDNAFSGCDSLVDVYFPGDQIEWRKTRIEPYFMPKQLELLFPNASIHYIDETVLSITSQPQNCICYPDNNITLSVCAKGVDLKYQWQLYSNGEWIYYSESDFNELDVWVTNKYYQRQFRCIISDALGNSKISNVVSITLAAAIINQPENYMGSLGETAVFNLDAEGEALNYQWQVYKEGVWKNTSLQGAKTNSLSVEVLESRNEMQFRCVVKDVNGYKLISDTVMLSVNPITITSQPEDYIGSIGDTANFYIETEGEALSYQWQVYKSGTWKNTSLSGNKSDTLEVGIEQSRKDMLFRCLISDSNGFVVASKEAKLIIPIIITDQPQDYYGEINDTAHLNICAEGENLTYQWQVFKSGTWKNTSLTGNNTDTLEVGIVASRNGMQFRCVITDNNGYKIISKTAHLFIPIIITEQPQDYYGPTYDTAIFNILAEGENLTYQWQVYKSGTWKNTSLPGNKTDTLEVVIDSSRDGMQFRCVVSGINGYRVTSDIATLTVNPIRIIEQPEDYYGYINGWAYFNIFATGNGIKYQWQFFENGEWFDSPLPGNKSSWIHIDSLSVDDGMRLRCLVKDKDGFELASREVSLTICPITIIEEPAIYVGPLSSIAVFNIKAEGEGLSYQWQIYKNDAWKNTSLSGNKTDTLKIESLPYRLGMPIRCAITGVNGYTVYSKDVFIDFPESYSNGSLGSDFFWYIDMNGTLNIYGTGEMEFSNGDYWAWRWLVDSDKIETVIVSDKVTSIGDHAFDGCYNLTDVILPYSVTYIGEDVFYNCYNLNSVVLNKEAYNSNAFLDISPDILHFYYDVSYTSNVNGSVTGKYRSFGTDTNELSIVPNEGFKVGKVTAIDENGNETELYPDIDGVVTMPDSDTDITINVSFVPTLSITNQPDDFSGPVGDTATFEIEAEGEDLTYQWQVYKNGAWKNTSLTGNTTSSIDVEITEARDGMTFRCVVKDGNGNKVISEEATLIVEVPQNYITITTQPESAEKAEGETVIFNIEAEGEDLTYQWQVYKNGVWKNTSLAGNKTNSLEVEALASRDGMTFRCVVTNGEGASVVSDEVKVLVV